jgi:DNA-binding CsgD family transcriptional regulator/sugar-specific transcriptional regulator TrmB
LELFGLTTVAQHVYEAMLARHGSDLAELCERLSLSESVVRLALDELLDAGLLRESREHPGRLRAVDPDVGLGLLLRRQEEDLARRRLELAASRVAAARAVAEYSDIRLSDHEVTGRRLLGLDAVQTELEILIKNVRHEVLAVTYGSTITTDALEAARPVDAAMLQHGISVNVLYQDSVRNDPATHAYARWLNDQGGQVRTAPLLPPRMLIYDREVALIPIDPDDTARGALCTREPGMLASLTALYERAWEAAVPLGADRTTDPHTGLSPLERNLLKLLASGLTDESAAKRLGVSLSTVRRQMAGIMERLGATSRFEAGLKAAQRGWL